MTGHDGHRGGGQVVRVGPAEVDGLPRQRIAPATRDVTDQRVQGVGVSIAVVAVRPPAAGRHDAAFALGQEQKRERRRDRVGFQRRTGTPITQRRVLTFQQSRGPLAIPIVVPDQPPTGQPAGAFQRVQIIVIRLQSAAGVGRGGEPPPQPLQPTLDGIAAVFTVATAADPAVLNRGPADTARGPPKISDHPPGNDQRTDAGTRHAARIATARPIVPTAVVRLRSRPILGGSLQRFRIDPRPGISGGP